MTRIGTRLVLSLVLAVGLGCGGPAPEREMAPCAHLSTTLEVRGDALCEDVWTCERPPGGSGDRLGIRRLAPCGNLTGAVALTLPDRHMAAAAVGTDAASDLRLYLAQSGAQVWSLSYRSHLPSLLPTQPAPEAIRSWTFETWLADVSWAIGFVRGVLPSPVILIGIGDGATLAYEVVRPRRPDVAGLVVIDGALEPAPPASGSGPLIEATVGALGWDEGEQLVRITRLGARNPSPVAGFVTAGEALADALFRAPGWGEPGGLSAAALGLSDPAALADHLAERSRWWPTDVARHGVRGAPAARLPVLAFAAGRRGRAWTEGVRAAAEAFGGDDAETRVLPDHGHLDLLVGWQSARRVYEPVRRWIETHRPRPSLD